MNTKKLISGLSLLTFSLMTPFINNISIAEQTSSILENYIKNFPSQKFYILGPGDEIYISVSEETKDTLDQIIRINGEGFSKLKRLKKVFIAGLTIQELTEILNKEYSKFVFNPDVKIEIKAYRPIKIFVDGEVVNPGLQTLLGNNEVINIQDSNKNNTEQNSFKINNTLLNESQSIGFPTLFDVIKKSGGITAYANLEKIEITRKNSITSGGGRIFTKVNLMEALNLKDISQNIRVFDGDTVLINRGDMPALEQISKAIKSNINPKFINVYVSGRVEYPGAKTINRTGSLQDALLLSELKILKGDIIFIRYNSNGSIDRRKFRFKKDAKAGSSQNPYLRDGDIILVGKSRFNIANEILTEITSPFQSLVTGYGTYKLLTD
tara:strand:- start:4401 stop:5543 length:1143 start_codon:yes stop_codon:yes gene_type:complete